MVDVLKVGIVLTLAFSWPAFRTVVYDVTLKGPAEVANVIQASSGNGSGASFVNRLQATDNAIAQLTRIGAGRNTGELIDRDAPGGSFQSAALEEDNAFGSARLLFLAGVIGTLALLRVAAGLLLALAPIVAALYFFPQSRGIFAGWLKGLVFTFAGSIGATLLLSVELAIMQSLIADALRVREFGYATPSAPTELFAITTAFAVALILMLWLLAKVTFYRGWLTLPAFPAPADLQSRPSPVLRSAEAPPLVGLSRTERLRETVERSTLREMNQTQERLVDGSRKETTNAGFMQTSQSSGGRSRLGSSQRRPHQRPSRAAQNRDRN